MHISLQKIIPSLRNVHHFPVRFRSHHYVNQNRYFGVNYSNGKYSIYKPLPVTPLPTTSSLLSMQCPDITSNGSSMYYSITGSEMTENEVKRAVGDISEKFSEAMELMNDARSSQGTVYFSEDVLDTQEQVKETLSDYRNLLSKLNDNQRKMVIQSIGLKMEELKAQMSLLEDLAKE